MSSLNLYTVVARLTRDPEYKPFQNGGGVTGFGIAYTGERKYNKQSGKYEDVPCFIDCKAFDAGEDKPGRRLGKIAMDYLKKGVQVCLVGHLILEEWNDSQTGQKRRAHKYVIDNIVLLSGQNAGKELKNDAPPDDDGSGGGGYDQGGTDNGIPF